MMQIYSFPSKSPNLLFYFFVYQYNYSFYIIENVKSANMNQVVIARCKYKCR